MDNLKMVLDSLDLDSITNLAHNFFEAAEGYGNKLKLSIAVATIITESLQLLDGIDTSSFLSELRERLEKIESDAEKSRAVHCDHFNLDREVRAALCEGEDETLLALEKSIRADLSKMDASLRDLLSMREKLPISEIVSNQ